MRAQLQLVQKAYLHHYETHGVEADFIHERSELLQQVVDEYEGVRGAFGPAATARSPGGLDSPTTAFMQSQQQLAQRASLSPQPFPSTALA